MEELIPVLAVFVFFGFLLKIGFYPRWGVPVAAFCCSLFVWWVTPWLTEQSKGVLEELVTSRPHLLNLSVCAVLEAAVMIAFCFDSCAKVSSRHRRLDRVGSLCLRLYPGLLVCGALGYAVMMCLFSFPGMDFGTLSWMAAAVTFPAVCAGAWLLRVLVRSVSLRLELLFLVNLFIVILCIVATGY